MTLRQLELFLALVKTPHLSQVAKDFGLTQSAVSMAIKSLEETLGKLLFDRIHKRLVVNENGRIFSGWWSPLFLVCGKARPCSGTRIWSGISKWAPAPPLPTIFYPRLFMSLPSSMKGCVWKNNGQYHRDRKLIEDGELDIGFVEGSITVLN